jgi:hypothetical protein
MNGTCVILTEVMAMYRNVFAVVVSACLSSPMVVAAPIPWLDSHIGNGHYYELIVPRGGITWRNANTAANASSFLGQTGHLLTVNSEAEWQFVTSNFEHQGGTWIGLTDRIVEGQFEWVTKEPLEFEAWARNEPNNAGDEDYVEYQLLDEGWAWNDFRDARDLHSPDFPIGYIVEYPFARPIGDFDPDNALTASDIDLLTVQMNSGSYDPRFDLSADGAVDIADRRLWIEGIKGSYFGDSNLDGEFNSGDFVVVFQGGEYEDDIPRNSTWATGDWNGDFEFGTLDFLIAFQSAGYEAGPRRAVTFVPEPRSNIGFFGLGILMFRSKLRRCQ